MPSIGICFRFYTQMRVQKKTKLLPIKLKTVYTTVHLWTFPKIKRRKINHFVFVVPQNQKVKDLSIYFEQIFLS